MSITKETAVENFCIEGIDVDGDIDNKEKMELSFEEVEMVRSKFKDSLRIVATKLNNIFNDYRIPHPQKVSLAKWKNQFFRATHPSLREQEEKAVNSLGKIKKSFEAAMRMLENVSTGSNRGVGGNVDNEEVEQYLNQVLEFRKLLILKQDTADKIIKIINQDPDSKNIKKELKNGELEEEIEVQSKGWESLLRDAIERHVEEYEKRTGKKIVLFDTGKDLWAHRNRDRE